MSERGDAVDLGDVQRTLFLPLWGRACESEKHHPLLVDEMALEIMERVDFDFSTMVRNITELTQIAWIMRSMQVDAVIDRHLEKHPRATIVNIGCGLDTTFSRVDNGQLLWYDLDLPDVIELRRRLIGESERRKMISTSFLDDGWLKEIAVGDSVLFIAAGVFYYFEEEEIKTFLKKLADAFPCGEVLFDVCSPLGVKMANQMVVKRAGLAESSFLKWGLKQPRDISSWDKRIKILATLTYFRDRRISLKLRLLGLISNLLKIQYMIHLGLSDVD